MPLKPKKPTKRYVSKKRKTAATPMKGKKNSSRKGY